jgi:hypothetical protein
MDRASSEDERSKPLRDAASCATEAASLPVDPLRASELARSPTTATLSAAVVALSAIGSAWLCANPTDACALSAELLPQEPEHEEPPRTMMATRMATSAATVAIQRQQKVRSHGRNASMVRRAGASPLPWREGCSWSFR